MKVKREKLKKWNCFTSRSSSSTTVGNQLGLYGFPHVNKNKNYIDTHKHLHLDNAFYFSTSFWLNHTFIPLPSFLLHTASRESLAGVVRV